MSMLKKFETCQRQVLIGLVERMNKAHAEMGGRDNRPERKALLKCMAILQKEIDREHG